MSISLSADRASDASGAALLSILLDDTSQVGLRDLRNHLGHRHPSTAVHAHIKGAFPLVTEPSLRFVYLMGRHAQIEQHALQLATPDGIEPEVGHG